MHTRPIPASGEALPVIGCGTWLGFDRAPGDTAFDELQGVLAALFDAGGRVIDSSPMYGKAEAAVGELLSRGSAPAQPFVATKVWTTGRAAGVRQLEQSLALLHRERLDLLQVHNLVDWRTQLATLREWKAAGRVRYVGITHYTASAHAEVEQVLRSEKLDFLQINYSVQEPEAARRLLPLAQERGVAVLVNRPLGGGMLRRLAKRPLPPWASGIGCSSWSQLLLKFVLSQPAVTCAIPGSGSARHMAENVLAGSGVLPEPAFWHDKLAAFG